VALVQAGFEAAVAPLGTAITDDQLDQLWSIAPEPLVALDGDDAGMAAAQRLIDRALPRLAAGRSLRFVLLPKQHDPDDVLRAGGPEAMQALIDQSQPIVELLWRRETEGQPPDSPERRAALDARLRAHLARIRDEGLRAHWAAEIRDRRARLFAPAAAAPAASRGRGPGRFPGARARRTVEAGASASAKASILARSGGDTEARIRESAILLGLVNHPGLLPRFDDRLDRMPFLCVDLAEIRDVLLSLAAEDLPQGAEAGGAPAFSEEITSVARVPTLPVPDMAERIAQRLGFDPLGRLRSLGPVRANPHLRVGADARGAALAIEEEIVRHAAWIEQQAELREAVRAFGSDAVDEGLTWRLRAVTDARHEATRVPLGGEDGPDEAEGDSLATRLLAQGAYRRTRKR
jgi:DNA primase